MKKLYIFFLLIVVSCSNEDEDQICNEFELKLNCGEVIYPKESDSPYVLPWEVGKNYKVAQGNCTEGSHSYGSYNQFAYDFTMPIGTKIVAIRSGIVVGVEERNFDKQIIKEISFYWVGRIFKSILGCPAGLILFSSRALVEVSFKTLSKTSPNTALPNCLFKTSFGTLPGRNPLRFTVPLISSYFSSI